MKTQAAIVLPYALIILVGGIMGHVKAASVMSLIMGIVFGIALLVSAWLAFKGNIKGIYAALVLGFVLDAFFTYRLLKTHKFMPAGMMCFASFIFLVALAFSLRKKATRPSA